MRQATAALADATDGPRTSDKFIDGIAVKIANERSSARLVQIWRPAFAAALLAAVAFGAVVQLISYEPEVRDIATPATGAELESLSPRTGPGELRLYPNEDEAIDGARSSSGVPSES